MAEVTVNELLSLRFLQTIIMSTGSRQSGGRWTIGLGPITTTMIGHWQVVSPSILISIIATVPGTDLSVATIVEGLAVDSVLQPIAGFSALWGGCESGSTRVWKNHCHSSVTHHPDILLTSSLPTYSNLPAAIMLPLIFLTLFLKDYFSPLAIIIVNFRWHDSKLYKT